MSRSKSAKKPTPRARRGAADRPASGPAARRKQGAKTPKRAAAPRASAKRLPLVHWLPKLLGRSTTDGTGVVLAVLQKDRGKLQQHLVALDRPTAASERIRLKEGTTLLKEPAAAARLLHGAAHPERLRLMAELLPSPRTHHDLKTATGLKPGPLYHHIRELERAGLVVSPARNRYELTEVGRLTFLLTAGLTMMSSKGRRAAPWRIRRGVLRPR